MPKTNPVFDQARGRATPELVESLFSAPGSYRDGAELWTLNPLRGDKSVGSFSINVDTGAWYDNATNEGGDLIKLLVDSGKAPSLTKAAEMIVAAIGGTVDHSSDSPAPSHLDRPKSKKAKDLHKPVIPIPEEMLHGPLKARVTSEWAVEHHGKAVHSWAWRNASGQPWCATVRYETTKPDGTVAKDVLPHYWGDDGKWHEGNPLDHGRPPYRANEIAKAPAGTRFLVVEGEKKVMQKVTGWLLTTWIGGASQWTKTDWSALEDAAKRGDVLGWPDADWQSDKGGKLKPWNEQPGMAAMLGIAKRLPGMKVLDTSSRGKASPGWDLADAIAEGIDPVEFIASCPIVSMGGPPSGPDASKTVNADPGTPFLVLGYDKTAYYFMRRATRTIYAIGMGSFNASKLGELAPLAWWSIMGHVGDQGAIKVATAQEFALSLQHDAGFFDPKRIRGAGVWRDRDGIILNDGRRIVTMDGRSYGYDEYASAYYYVPSLVAFGDMAGPESTDDDGDQLEELFKALEFEELSQAVLLMGWCLLSPFGGVLRWRPHVWLTGQKGSGKSWVMDNIVLPICGPFAYQGSGKDTEAGIRWALDQDARPSILAEMEPKNKASREKIASILELARNASDDGSGSINISQPGGGTKSFRIRSMFAFSSKVMPIEDDAVSSRITRLELAKSKDESRKIKRCVELLSDLLDDPGRFTRRIFHALPRIVSDIEYLRTAYLSAFKSQRAADQLAPMLAAAWAARSTESIRTAGPWLVKWIAELAQESKVTVADEDTFMAHLVGLRLRDDDGHTRTVAELLTKVADREEGDGKALVLLERHGITLRHKGGYVASGFVLSIATKLPALAELFKDTPWGDAYGEQVRRCEFTLETKTRQIRMAAGKPRCHDLVWEGFRDRYMGTDGGEEPTLADGVETGEWEDIPF